MIVSNFKSAYVGSAAWYVAYTQPRREHQVVSALDKLLGLTVYMPELYTRVGKAVEYVPFFPRYLFVRANLQVVAASAINAVPGIVRLVTFDDTPQIIPEALVEAVAQQMRHLNTQQASRAYPFERGQKVQFKQGPLQGYEAVFAGAAHPSERVKVLIRLLGQLREVTVDLDALEDVPIKLPKKHKRQSRGRRRKIGTTARA